jgi:hypothetical protein
MARPPGFDPGVGIYNLHSGWDAHRVIVLDPLHRFADNKRILYNKS